jgi:carotenoid cleavage dioxygenase-like enzyme
MHRRRFLSQALVAAIAATGIAKSARGAPAADFERGLAREPWLAGWKTVGRESLGPTAATVEGRWPAELAGTLYRNGPAWFDRAGFRYDHWFDGDGMVQAWQLGHAGVTHRGRMVGTPKFRREQAAGRFVTPSAGTPIPDAASLRNNDDMNTANTAVLCHAGRVYALWEAGSATEIDPVSLQTRGPRTWREDLAAAPFSAHPLTDRDGSVWNVGALSMLGTDGLLVWRIGADGELREAVTTPAQAPGYLHSFTMTASHLVLMLTPYRMGEGTAFFERWQFLTDEPVRIAVVPKDDLAAVRWFEADFAAVYHWADATERDGVIEARCVRHHDLGNARSPAAAAMHGKRQPAAGGARTASLETLRIDLRRNRATWIDAGVSNIEFPVAAPGIENRFGALFAPTTVGAPEADFFNAVCAIGAHRETHRYAGDVMVEEHLFVPRPGGKPGTGWLVGTLLDYRKQRSGVAVLDAAHVGDGPLATAWIDTLLPLGFHGAFVAA